MELKFNIIEADTVIKVKKHGDLLDVTIIHSAEKKTVIEFKSVAIKDLDDIWNKIKAN